MSPTEIDLKEALAAAGRAHHDFESRYLGGVRDEAWSGWYAAYALGRLGDFALPTDLARWLEAAPTGGDWAGGAARAVLARLAVSGPE